MIRMRGGHKDLGYGGLRKTTVDYGGLWRTMEDYGWIRRAMDG